MQTNEVITKLRKDAAELQSDLGRWPVELRGTDKYGGYTALSADVACWTSAADELERLGRESAAKQAKIDALMLEYCPDEMTSEQVAEWGRHQRPSLVQPIKSEEQLAVIGGAGTSDPAKVEVVFSRPLTESELDRFMGFAANNYPPVEPTTEPFEPQAAAMMSAILGLVGKGYDELVVRRIWDVARRAALQVRNT